MGRIYAISINIASIIISVNRTAVFTELQNIAKCHQLNQYSIQLQYSEANQMQYILVQYSIVLDSTVQYSTVQYSAVQYSTVQYSRVQYSAVQYSTVQYSTAQYSTVQYSTVQYSTVQYSAVQYSTVQYSAYAPLHLSEIYQISTSFPRPFPPSILPSFLSPCFLPSSLHPSILPSSFFLTFYSPVIPLPHFVILLPPFFLARCPSYLLSPSFQATQAWYPPYAPHIFSNM